MEDVTDRGAQIPIFVGYNVRQAKAIVEQVAKMQAWAWQNIDKWRIPEFNMPLEELFGDVQGFLNNMVGVDKKHANDKTPCFRNDSTHGSTPTT